MERIENLHCHHMCCQFCGSVSELCVHCLLEGCQCSMPSLKTENRRIQKNQNEKHFTLPYWPYLDIRLIIDYMKQNAQRFCSSTGFRLDSREWSLFSSFVGSLQICSKNLNFIETDNFEFNPIDIVTVACLSFFLGSCILQITKWCGNFLDEMTYGPNVIFIF